MNTFFSTNLKYLRKSLNLSQTTLAKKLKISRSLLSYYENNQSEPTLKILDTISKYFNVSIDQLINSDLSQKNNFIDLNKFKLTFDLEFDYNKFSKNDLLKKLKSIKIYYEKKYIEIKKILDIEIPKKIKEVDELIEFLENKKSDISEKVNDKKTNTKNLNKELEKEKNKTEFGKEISIEAIYQDEFRYLRDKYKFKNIKDFFRPIDQIGDVSCGLPSYAFEDIENTYLLPKCYLYAKEKYFILKAKGDSMNKLFEEGEKILVRQSSGANNGDIVIAYIYENNEALCKKYFEEDDEVTLVPCSTNEIHKVQEYNSNELCILGVVVSSLNEFLEDIDFEELEEDIRYELED
ncbi:S24 family peptidase (plasmid) [Clostridium baratii]